MSKTASDSSDNPAPVASSGPAPLKSENLTDFTKPTEFKMKIQGGVLENLGIRMYTKLGKVLVEFAANAYDSDSPFVDIVFDVPAITSARDLVRKSALARLAEERKLQAAKPDSRRPKRKAHVIVDPLPDEVTIVISDRGHGMTAQEMAARFLPLNRNRRRDATGGEENDFYSEAGKRLVMGRKGIGKLSAFGVAGRMVIRSKRAGQKFWTELDLQANTLMVTENITNVAIPHQYVDADAADLDKHGTEITLSGLRCDSMNFTVAEIAEVLNQTFYPIKPEEFDIRINSNAIVKIQPSLEFWYPENIQKTEMAEDIVRDADWGEISFKYRVQFRDTSLPADKRGVYIYSKNRLAMEPSLLGLHSGMHNFMAHQYMECIVESDDIDNLNIDVIGTNRSSIIQNSDLIKMLLDRITQIMKDAVNAHSAFREKQADEEIATAPQADELRRILKTIAPNQRRNARSLARVFISRFGAGSDEFKFLTPLIVGTANAGEILIDLIKVSNSAESVAEIAPKLIELREIERSDTIKLFQGRRNGIHGLQRIVANSVDNWGTGPHQEDELHRLFKASPWLVRPDLSGYIASDLGMTRVLSRIAHELKIDCFADPKEVDPSISKSDTDDTAEIKKTKRPDLVALLGDGDHPSRVFVIELKAPTIALRSEHLQQLQTYMRKVRDFLNVAYSGSPEKIVVEGALIGSMPKPDTKSDPQLDLLEKIRTRGPTSDWEVIGLTEALRRTERVHSEMLKALASDETDDDEDANDQSVKLLREPTASLRLTPPAESADA
ncbi:ATP-binding protein [Tardiphaga sp. 803_E3_N1_3]|uniref:ATP-binding protein n=1 Tax=Tardiphaga sp. 803_E3_N1_3 TaxID=3240785 RepID=UPI003F224857